jgi:peptide deformylase
MKLEIVQYGDPVLRAKGARIEKVNERVRQLATDMLDTMREANGVGLAAQQVGEPVQLTVVDVSQVEDRPSTLQIDGHDVDLAAHMPLVLINPEVSLGGQAEIGNEGCLSFPEMTADIERASAITLRARNLENQQVEFEATGLLARAIQHEVDHLNGILFIDRMNSATKASLSSRLKRLQKETLRGIRAAKGAAKTPVAARL